MSLHERGFKDAHMQVGSMLSSKGYTRRQKWTDPVAVDADRLKAALATSASVVTTVTTFLAQPDFARIISITPGGTTTDVAEGNITVTGTNIRDEVISENVAIAANATGAVYTTKAFKTVTSVAFPAQDGAGATFDIGVTDALGLDRCMDGNNVILATMDGVYETTRPTVTSHATDVSKNTIDPNTALNASKDLIAYFISTEIRKES
jgi:hypothetical protein